MRNRDQINQEAELVTTLKLLSQSYEEISVMRIQKVKGSVLATREFLEKLSEVYNDVKINYRHAIANIARKHKTNPNILEFSTASKNNKEIAIFVSANSKFYGGVVQKVYVLFKEYVKLHPATDLVILGKVGRELMEGSDLRRQYKYFDVPDSKVTLSHLQPVMQHITNYQKVKVFYPRFTNMVTQDPAVVQLAGEEMKPVNEQVERDYIHYFFEPSLAVIVDFFESQVLTSDFKQTMHEGELARLAGRIRAMEEMLSNIEEKQKQLRAEGIKYKKAVDNKKRLESIAGRLLWKT